MRDRRNTNLSVSSTDSSTSASARSNTNSLNEKRYSSPPLPSPTLPVPVTKENRPRVTSRRMMAAKTVAVICLALLTWKYMLGWMTVSLLTGDVEGVDESSELVAGNDLPGEPTALMVDVNGHSRWTVSIPHNITFPLAPTIYHDICENGAGLQSTLAPKTRYRATNHWLRKGATGYYAADDTFLDIEDAENAIVLPKPKREKLSNVCLTSLTFVLESEEASFGKTLLHLWMSYGLAKNEGRAFFIDDSRWAWGKYASYFAPPPKPNCRPPPAHHIVPCPHSAKHIVVSAATAPWTFGPLFHKEFFKSRRGPRIYDLLTTGYEALFKLTGEDSLYAASRIAQLKDDASANGNQLVGMQIRRGDLHPLEYQYSRDYLPLERYSESALTFKAVSVILASDDPEIINSPELRQFTSDVTIQRAQERIQLATKTTLDQASPVQDLREPGSAYVKHFEENSGWEGGFYSRLFLSLGGARNGQVPEQAMRLRELVGRAYLLDLAVLAESDGIVCAVSSATCRVLGVMLGDEKMKEGRWRNVDDGRPWTWDGRK